MEQQEKVDLCNTMIEVAGRAAAPQSSIVESTERGGPMRFSKSFVCTVNEWLDQNVSTRHGNVHANALLKLAEELDNLGEHNPDEKGMNKKQHADAVRQYVEAIEKKQAKILEDTDATAVAGIRKWGATSLVWLGMVPIGLLSGDLREQVVEYLERIHGIDTSVFHHNDDERR